MNPSRRVIINADDFGLSSAVNEAVLAAAHDGILSSATIMTNMPGFFEATRGALSCPRLGVGVHLNLLRGRPIAEPDAVRSLLDGDGRFLGNPGALWLRFMRGVVEPAHVVTELAAQVQRVIDHGIKPTHLDSEKHLHIAIPHLWEAVCATAERFAIPCVRVAREQLRMGLGVRRPRASQLAKAALIAWHSRGLARVAARHRLRFVDRFFGIALTGRMTADVYDAVFAGLPEGSMEIMCHPAERADAAGGAYESPWLDRHRVDEYRALIDAKSRDALIRSNATLIHYGEL